MQALRSVADRVVCLWAPEPFIAVGGAYEDFRQLSDEEVLSILQVFLVRCSPGMTIATSKDLMLQPTSTSTPRVSVRSSS